jgi:TrmH family RNA methyltransferase
MASIAPSKSPQGVLALCRKKEARVPDRLLGRRYLVLDGVQDPGNVGSILRTADAFGVDGVFLVHGCADVYAPKTLRAGMGAVFRCSTWVCGVETVGALVKESGLKLYGGAMKAESLDLRALGEQGLEGWAVAIGSEGQGLSAEILGYCDGTVKIPMGEQCESLNAGAAAAVILWELTRG